jgi:AraC-like DNA-binding protein
MEVINISFHGVSGLLASLAAALLLWVNQERKYNNRLLAFILVIFAIQNFMFILLSSRLILEMPWMLRIFAPTTFLLGPVVFIYTRSVLNDELKFRKYDWLLLIPAVLTLINFIPYYFLPIREKISYLNTSFYKQGQIHDLARGILPGKLYYLIRICWSGIFLFLNFQQIFRFRKKNTAELLSKNKLLLNWLMTFNGMLLLVWMVTILRLINPSFISSNLSIADILLGATILFVCLQLFFWPQILYGVFKPISTIIIDQEIAESKDIPSVQTLSNTVHSDDMAEDTEKLPLTISPEEQLEYKNLVENLFREKRPFLSPDYSLEKLVADTHVPRYILSAFINREYGMGFREYLNRYRVDFFKANLNDPLWDNFTLEAIAEKCGFNSRSTFISNFKKIAGQTPSDFIKSSLGSRL